MADNTYEDLFNSDVVDVNGNKIGAIGQVYLDDQTGQPSWVTVKTGWFGLKETFVPLELAIVADGVITVPYSEEKVKDAPRVDPDKHLDADEEAQLYSYYGIATVLASDEPAAEAPEDVLEAPQPVVAAPSAAEGVQPRAVASDDSANEPLLAPAEGESPEEAAAAVMDDSIDPQVAPIIDEDSFGEATPQRPGEADLYNEVQDPDRRG